MTKRKNMTHSGRNERGPYPIRDAASYEPAPENPRADYKSPVLVNVSALLSEALDATRYARACIAQNRGQDKHDAHSAYEDVVANELVPKLLQAIDLATADCDARDVERLAALVLKFVTKKGL